MNNLGKNISGFTLIEIIMVMALVTFLIASTYNTFLAGQNFSTRLNHNLELQDTLKKSFDRIIPEVSLSGHDQNGVFQLMLVDNNGINNSDIIRFSIPVICEKNGNIVNAEGNVAHWGAPLTWGCTSASCQDVDLNCETIEYKYIEYAINKNNELTRRVLDYSQNLVREDVIADHIFNLQAEMNYNQRVLVLTLEAQIPISSKSTSNSNQKRQIFLRNAH